MEANMLFAPTSKNSIILHMAAQGLRFPLFLPHSQPVAAAANFIIPSVVDPLSPTSPSTIFPLS